jgi:hypothetical protein
MASSISVKVVAAGATLLSELYDNVGAHEGLAVEICYSILGILGALELDKPKA